MSIAAESLFRDVAMAMEPLLKKRIADEVQPIIDDIVREEVSKIALRLVQSVSFEGNKIIIQIDDRRSKP